MNLKTWRIDQTLTLDSLARELGITGVNPGRTLQRIENGESSADADLIADISKRTQGAVTAVDMQAVRLAYLEKTGRRRAEAVA